MFTTIENDLKMQLVPCRFGEQFFEIGFGLNDRTSVGESPSLCKSVDMGIDWKRRVSETLAHYDGSRFVPDAW